MPLSKEDRKTVVEALRSGEYAQGRGYLACEPGSGCYYCVLGVVADVLLDTHWTKQQNSGVWMLSGSSSHATIDNKLAQEIGLTIEEQVRAYSINDNGLHSFRELADMIESEGLL